MEEWKTIPGFENYQASNTGFIKSFNHKKPRILKPKLTRTGYYGITLCKDGIHKDFAVHRAVGLAFLENPENKPDIDHINRIRTDNRVCNLRWATKSENSTNKVFPTNTGEANISKIERYDVSFYKDKKPVFRKSCRTLEDAIKARNEYLQND